MSGALETGWLPDWIYHEGKLESGLALFMDAGGQIVRWSRTPEDLARATRLANRALLPGLVNVHSHSFQRVIRGRTEHRTSGLTASARDTFWTWREAMYHAANRLSPEDVYHAARMAFLEMVLSGITTVGEFHYLHHAPDGTPYGDRNLLALEVLRAAEEIGLRIALLRTAYARAGWQKPADPRQARFITARAEDFIADTEALAGSIARLFPARRAWTGVAPHSVRAAPLDYLLEIAEYARAKDLPLHMHVAEQPAEIEASVAEYGLPPIALLHDRGVLETRFTGVHAIHATPDEIQYLADAKARVGSCPTTERNLGDGTVPADQMWDRGVGICFGSDSNTQIDLLEDARELEYHLRLTKLERAVLPSDGTADGIAKRLLDGATAIGAASLAAPGGSLEVGRPADFFTVDLNDVSLAGANGESLLNHIVYCAGRASIRDVYVDGRVVVRDGRHPLEEAIVRDFAGVQRRLWAAE